MKNLLHENGELVIENVLGYRYVYSFDLIKFYYGYKITITTRITNEKYPWYNEYEKKESELFESKEEALNYAKDSILELNPKLEETRIKNEDINF